MSVETIFGMLPAILSGIAVCIPLVIQLVKYVKRATEEKNWNALLDMVLKYIEEAEKMFDNGAQRKEWVLTAIKASADSINYPIDMEQLSKLVDELVQMSKQVNVTK